MGCGNSTPTNSKSNSLATLDSHPSRPGSKTAPINKSLGSVLRDHEENRSDSRTSCRDSGIDSAKTSDGRRRQGGNRVSDSFTNNNNVVGQLTCDKENSSTKKGLAFEVMMDSETKPGQSSIIAKHPPRRLQKLDITREPTLTADMIEEKLRASEERRRQVLAERGESSKKSSRRRKELMAAKYFGTIQDSAEHQKKLGEKADSASKNRAKAQADVIAKQRKRELRARQAKERLERMKEDEKVESHFDVEKDEHFNADDDLDSWLDGENNTVLGSASTTSERIYDGRSSPMKKPHPAGHQTTPRNTALHSESEDDQGWAAKAHGTGQGDKDDFFD